MVGVEVDDGFVVFLMLSSIVFDRFISCSISLSLLGILFCSPHAHVYPFLAQYLALLIPPIAL